MMKMTALVIEIQQVTQEFFFFFATIHFDKGRQYLFLSAVKHIMLLVPLQQC